MDVRRWGAGKLGKCVNDKQFVFFKIIFEMISPVNSIFSNIKENYCLTRLSWASSTLGEQWKLENCDLRYIIVVWLSLERFCWVYFWGSWLVSLLWKIPSFIPFILWAKKCFTFYKPLVYFCFTDTEYCTCPSFLLPLTAKDQRTKYHVDL